MKKFFFILVLICDVLNPCEVKFVDAAEACKDLNVASWTQEQKNMIQSVAGELSFDANGVQYVSPKGPAGRDLNEQVEKSKITVCFDNPKFNVNQVVSEQKVLDRLAADNFARQLAAEEQTRKHREDFVSGKQKLLAYGFTNDELLALGFREEQP